MADVENTPGASVSLEEDTRTRKTVRLRTLTPKATGPSLENVPGESDTDGAVDTRTRMTFCHRCMLGQALFAQDFRT